MNLYSQIKPALDKAIASINESHEEGRGFELTEQEHKGKVQIFLVSHTAETNIILNVPLASNKMADRSDAYSKIFVAIIKMGLQTMDLIVKEARDQANNEAADREEEAVVVTEETKETE
jgi:hypothetical protein